MESKPSILETHERHVATIPQGPSRALVVMVREHGGRRYVTTHAWNRHKKLGVWYPNRKHPNRAGFSISVERAAELAQAIQDAVDGVETPKPDWLEAWEQEHEGNPLDDPA